MDTPTIKGVAARLGRSRKLIGRLVRRHRLGRPVGPSVLLSAADVARIQRELRHHRPAG
jgi:hypothetical protein